VIFPPNTSIKKTDYPLLQKGMKTTRKTVTLDTKMIVIRKMEAGEKRCKICNSLGLAPATVSIIMAKGEKN
jgi:CENP-B N-terminal DNA-binding domain.